MKKPHSLGSSSIRRHRFSPMFAAAILLSFQFCSISPHTLGQDETALVESIKSDPAFAALTKSIRDRAKAHAGDVSIAIEFLNSGKKILLNENRVMPTASLIKVAVMVEAYRQVENGEIKLDKRLNLKASDKVPGSGILTTHFDAGLGLTLKDAIRLMIAYSDNTATNLVIDQVGLKETCETMKKLGYQNTLINSKVYRGSTSTISPQRSKQYGLGSTTAAEMLELFKSIHLGKTVSKDACELMLEHLSACDDDTKLAQYLPAGTRIAHKTGAVSQSRCDAGIIYTPSGPVVVAVLTSKNKDRSWERNEASLLCSEIGKRVYDFAAAKNGPQPSSPIVLKEGSFGKRVEDLQRTLNTRLRPSPELSIDGDFGPATRAAVVQFQKQKKLDANGVVDRDVWQALSPLVIASRPVPDPKSINNAKLPRKPADALRGVPFVTAKAWAIADLATGKVLFHQDKDKRLDIASTTKIMTALLVIELAESNPKILEEKVTFSRRADRTRGSTSAIREGEIVSVKELLYGLLLPSGNDASVALAEHFGNRLGEHKATSRKLTNYDAFILAMNNKAKSLGMTRTAFANPHGLTAPNHQSSAADLIKLASASMKIKLFREYVSTRQRACTVDSVSGYKRNILWRNTNQLLGIETFQGVKTGTTTAAGACLVSAANRDGKQLLMVVLGAGSSRGRYVDSRNLYRWAWNQLNVDTPAKRLERK